MSEFFVNCLKSCARKCFVVSLCVRVVQRNGNCAYRHIRSVLSCSVCDDKRETSNAFERSAVESKQDTAAMLLLKAVFRVE